MAFRISGSKVRDETGKVIDNAGSHGEAVRAAADRSAPSSQVALTPSAGVTIFYEFEGAQRYKSIVDVDEARVDELSREDDPGKVKALIAATDEEVRKRHVREIRAVQVDERIQHGGDYYPAGSWVCLPDDGQAFVLTAGEFGQAYEPLAKPKKKQSS